MYSEMFICTSGSDSMIVGGPACLLLSSRRVGSHLFGITNTKQGLPTDISVKLSALYTTSL